MPKNVEAVKIEVEKEYGQCSSCFEMTTVDDPCCPMAGVIINGEYVGSKVEEEECS